MLCAIWHQLYNLQNVENIHRGVLLLVKLGANACNLTVKHWQVTREKLGQLFLKWKNSMITYGRIGKPFFT